MPIAPRCIISAIGILLKIVFRGCQLKQKTPLLLVNITLYKKIIELLYVFNILYRTYCTSTVPWLCCRPVAPCRPLAALVAREFGLHSPWEPPSQPFIPTISNNINLLRIHTCVSIILMGPGWKQNSFYSSFPWIHLLLASPTISINWTKIPPNTIIIHFRNLSPHPSTCITIYSEVPMRQPYQVLSYHLP